MTAIPKQYVPSKAAIEFRKRLDAITNKLFEEGGHVSDAIVCCETHAQILANNYQNALCAVVQQTSIAVTGVMPKIVNA